MKISIFAGVLLLSAALMFLGPENTDAQPNAQFANQHINEDMIPAHCTRAMNARGLAVNGNVCKAANTFIGDPLVMVRAICGNAGVPHNGGLRASNVPFHIIVCKVNPQGAVPPCQYVGEALNSRIIIRCDAAGNPIQFHGLL
ncbi:ribonuclease-like [Perca fluviatilis]|nr:ribonuclease-like [Perca fluviatilis]